jgi:hypothetical protein
MASALSAPAFTAALNSISVRSFKVFAMRVPKLTCVSGRLRIAGVQAMVSYFMPKGQNS